MAERIMDFLREYQGYHGVAVALRMEVSSQGLRPVEQVLAGGYILVP